MGYEDDMEDYYDEQMDKPTYKITYTVPNGTYYANTMLGLLWEVGTHRLLHLLKHGRWMD